MIALITGIAGQDGSYLAEFLLNKGYIVHGIIRRSSSFNTGRINHLINDNTTNLISKYLATTTSGIVLIPTRSAPTVLKNLTSAGVS